MKAVKSPTKVHNLTSHVRGGWVGSFEFVTKCDRGWASF